MLGCYVFVFFCLVLLFDLLFCFVLMMLYSPRKVHRTVAVCCIFHNLSLRPGLQDVPLSHANDAPDLHNSFSESGAKATQTMHINDAIPIVGGFSLWSYHFYTHFWGSRGSNG